LAERTQFNDKFFDLCSNSNKNWGKLETICHFRFPQQQNILWSHKMLVNSLCINTALCPSKRETLGQSL
jgi:hypothetical protein